MKSMVTLKSLKNMYIKEREQKAQMGPKLIMFSRNTWNVKSVECWITDFANGIHDLTNFVQYPFVHFG